MLEIYVPMKIDITQKGGSRRPMSSLEKEASNGTFQS
jgi:hypothetical protein